jgi:hypothetical protein
MSYALGLTIEVGSEYVVTKGRGELRRVQRYGVLCPGNADGLLHCQSHNAPPEPRIRVEMIRKRQKGKDGPNVTGGKATRGEKA